MSIPRIHVVMGVARSGTSLSAGLLDRLGVSMHGVDNASTQNPEGSFEDPRFITLTMEMEKFRLDEKYNELSQLAEQIPEHLQHYSEPRWGWKSALTHHVWGHFAKHLVPEETFLLFVHRGLEENARSVIEHRRVAYGHNITLEEAKHSINTSRDHLENVTWETRLWPHQLHLNFQLIRACPAAAVRAIVETARLDPTATEVRRAIALVRPNYQSWSPTI